MDLVGQLPHFVDHVREPYKLTNILRRETAFAAYKLGSMYSAGVHGFKMDTKRAKRWLAMAKDLSIRSGSLSPSELENVDCYLKKL